MRKVRQIGIFLIIIGAFIPSISYPFISLTKEASATKVVFAMKGVLYDTNLKDIEVVLGKGEWKYTKDGVDHYEVIAIPYRYILAFGTLLAFVGIGIVALYRNKRGTN